VVESVASVRPPRGRFWNSAKVAEDTDGPTVRLGGAQPAQGEPVGREGVLEFFEPVLGIALTVVSLPDVHARGRVWDLRSRTPPESQFSKGPQLSLGILPHGLSETNS